ncbi:MAG: histidine phosphatase family protein [Acidimicrobiales bacterium]
MATARIVLVRHSETEWSASGQHTSRTDVPLTDRGRRDAQALGVALSAYRFGLVLTSPLSRAADTCRLAGFGAIAEVDDDLREWDYGDYEGVTTPEIRRSVPGWTVWTHPSPNGEPADEVTARADRVLARAEPVVESGDDVALFGHGHMSRVIGARWLGLAAVDGRRFALDAGSVSELGFERETRVIRLWNRTVEAY